MNKCTHCGNWFTSRYPNARLCLSCWKKREHAFAQWDGLQSYIRLLEAELETANEMETEPAIPPPMLSKLIRLCHPDRHGNSPMANEVTRWLLEQRKA